MKPKIFRHVAFFALFCYHPASNATDIDNFDIAGVKLGMTYIEAIEAIKKFMDVGDEDLSRGFERPNPISNKIEPPNISLHINHNRIGIHFTPNVLDTDNPISVVDHMTYTTRGWPKDIELMKEAVSKKYLEHSFIKGGRMIWCENVGKVCSNGSMFRYDGMTSLDASDSKYKTAFQEYKSSKDKTEIKF